MWIWEKSDTTWIMWDWCAKTYFWQNYTQQGSEKKTFNLYLITYLPFRISFFTCKKNWYLEILVKKYHTVKIIKEDYFNFGFC